MPIYEFQCTDEHLTEEVWDIAARPDSTLCGACGETANRVVSRPTIHTLATHMIGAREKVLGDGEYVDQNIFDRKTGKPSVVKSLAHKKQLLKDHGLYEKEPSPQREDARKKAKRISVSG